MVDHWPIRCKLVTLVSTRQAKIHTTLQEEFVFTVSCPRVLFIPSLDDDDVNQIQFGCRPSKSRGQINPKANLLSEIYIYIYINIGYHDC